jgi:pyruvate/2-oxoglutarate/acetoin dehydrogenase E1 component
MDPVIVFRTFDLAEAQMIRSRLEGAGLSAQVQHENSAANFAVAGGGVRVVVPPEQAAEAKALLESTSP